MGLPLKLAVQFMPRLHNNTDSKMLYTSDNYDTNNKRLQQNQQQQ